MLICQDAIRPFTNVTNFTAGSHEEVTKPRKHSTPLSQKCHKQKNDRCSEW